MTIYTVDIRGCDWSAHMGASSIEHLWHDVLEDNLTVRDRTINVLISILDELEDCGKSIIQGKDCMITVKKEEEE